jgi:hypothetical protein
LRHMYTLLLCRCRIEKDRACDQDGVQYLWWGVVVVRFVSTSPGGLCCFVVPPGVRIEVRFVYTGYGAGARWWGCARRKWVWHMDADALRKPNGALRRKKATNVSREGQPHAFGVNMQRSAIWR